MLCFRTGIRTITLDDTYTQLIIEDAWKTRARNASQFKEEPNLPLLRDYVKEAKKPIAIEQLFSNLGEKIFRPTVLVLGL